MEQLTKQFALGLVTQGMPQHYLDPPHFATVERGKHHLALARKLQFAKECRQQASWMPMHSGLKLVLTAPHLGHGAQHSA